MKRLNLVTLLFIALSNTLFAQIEINKFSFPDPSQLNMHDAGDGNLFFTISEFSSSQVLKFDGTEFNMIEDVPYFLRSFQMTDSSIWLQNYDEAWQYYPESDKKIPLPVRSRSYVTSPDGKTYFDINDEIHYFENDAVVKPDPKIFDGPITDFQIDKDGVFYIKSGFNLAIINGSQEYIKESASINYLTRDHEGVVYLADNFGNVFKGENESIREIPEYSDNISYTAFSADKKGKIWAGTQGQTVELLSFKDGSKVDDIPFDDLFEDGILITEIIVDNNNSKWLYSAYSGLLTQLIDDPINPVSTSVDEKLFPMHNVYLAPNPVQNTLKIVNQDKIDIRAVNIYDQLGKRVIQLESGRNQISEVNISDLKTGAYHMQIMYGTHNKLKTMMFLKI